MNQTDRNKYISLCLFAGALASLFAGQAIVASALAVIGVLTLMMSPHKSGNLFVITFFAGAVTLGVVNDYPFKAFPPTLFCMLALGLVFNFRSFLFSRLLIYRAMWMEPAGSIAIALSFIPLAIYAGYDLRQWLTAFPVFLFGVFSFIIYKDRSEAVAMLKEKNIEARVGAPAPDFKLADQFGNDVVLSDLLRKHHVLLIFVRGDWCPTCHMMLRSYFRNKEKFAEKNVRIVGIGPDPQGVNREIMQRIDEQSILLSDEEQATALLYTSQLQNNNPISKKMISQGIPLPASFLVHQNGKIAFTSRSDKAGEILQPDLIFSVLATFN